MVCQVYGDGVANHFVAVVHVLVDKLEIVGETLDSCDLSDCHAAIEVLFSRDEDLLVGIHLNHFGRLRMELALAAAGLNREARFVPTPHPVSGHEDGGERAYEKLVIGDDALVAIRLVLVERGDGGTLQIPYRVAERGLWARGVG